MMVNMNLWPLYTHTHKHVHRALPLAHEHTRARARTHTIGREDVEAVERNSLDGLNILGEGKHQGIQSQ